MFVEFLYELRKRRVPVGTQEAVALARALAGGLHESSLDGFYHVDDKSGDYIGLVKSEDIARSVWPS